MYNLYHITYTVDNGVTHKWLSVPAKSLVDAYIELQIKIPEAVITDIKQTGKIITIKEAE
jgi:hypothetical protein